jgi:phenylacetate-coenzyme A ligase PaaK-like adenylate-forming protein
MTKTDLMENWDEIVCDRRLNLAMANEHIDRVGREGPSYLLDSYHAMATGGTTGERGVVVWDFDGFRLIGSRPPAWGLSFGQHAGITAPTPTVVVNVASEGTSHAGGAIVRCFSNPAMFRTIAIAASKPIEQIVKELEAHKPHILGGYASILHELAERKRTGRLDISPISIAQSGEPLLPEIHAAISSAFGVPLRDMWGSTEIGFGASSFPGFDGLVVSEDLVIVEPVDAEGAPVPMGERAAKVLVTNLANKVLPIIRYEISDEVTLAPPDPNCPWKGQRIMSIHGRQDDAFHYAGRVVHPHTFRSVLTRHASVTEYQVQQTRRGADILVVPLSTLDATRLEREIVVALEKAGLSEPTVRIQQTERIERHVRSQKLKRFVPL